MLFNSPEFILLFLPCVVLAFYIGNLVSSRAAIFLVILSSFIFYSWENLYWLPILIFSIFTNFCIGQYLIQRRSCFLLFSGVFFNVALLFYFKYTNFFLESYYAVMGEGGGFLEVALPIGISFYTFQQIAYLVDAYRHQTVSRSIVSYAFFVSFFPQLIAGPIVHHSQIIEQLKGRHFGRFLLRNVNVGLAIFSLGLFKKVVLADTAELFATPVFDLAVSGSSVSFVEAWSGALFYTFQIYFDFSGYSDMAVGLARMFGLKLPVNFNSPYKATSIIEFWRRWHITLSTFLRDYLYIPLGGNRYGSLRRYQNLLVVMLVGGLWHGAGWTFVLWGGLHGTFLCINHIWRSTRARAFSGYWYSIASGGLTFIAVVVAWVFFRAETLSSAMNIVSGMFGFNGFEVTAGAIDDLVRLGVPEYVISDLTLLNRDMQFIGAYQITWIAFLGVIVWLMPNLFQVFEAEDPALDTSRHVRVDTFVRLSWSANAIWVLITIVMLVISIPQTFSKSPFLYFQF